MTQRKPKKAAPASQRPESLAQLRRALSRRKKAELVDALLELAQADRGALRQLTTRFEVAAAPRRAGSRDAAGHRRRDRLRRAGHQPQLRLRLRSVRRSEAQPGPLDRLGAVATGDAAGTGADEARELPGRNERRRADDPGHRRLF